MHERETVVERSIELAVREGLRELDEYQHGDRDQRERMEREMRASIALRRREEEI
jgi:hypothetical protein